MAEYMVVAGAKELGEGKMRIKAQDQVEAARLHDSEVDLRTLLDAAGASLGSTGMQ